MGLVVHKFLTKFWKCDIINIFIPHNSTVEFSNLFSQGTSALNVIDDNLKNSLRFHNFKCNSKWMFFLFCFLPLQRRFQYISVSHSKRTLNSQICKIQCFLEQPWKRIRQYTHALNTLREKHCLPSFICMISQTLFIGQYFSDQQAGGKYHPDSTVRLHHRAAFPSSGCKSRW